MADPKVSGFMIGMIWVGFFILIFGTFLATISSNYEVDQQNTDTKLYSAFDKMNTLTNLTENLRDESNIDEKEGAIDIIGGYFSGGYRVLKATGSSIDIFLDMLTSSFNDGEVNFVGLAAFQQAIFLSVIIIIFVGIIISAIMKWRL